MIYCALFCDLFFPRYLCIYLALLGLSCGSQDLQSSLQHVGYSSLSRDQTWAPCTWECRVLAPGLAGTSQRFYFMSFLHQPSLRVGGTHWLLLWLFPLHGIIFPRDQLGFLFHLLGGPCSNVTASEKSSLTFMFKTATNNKPPHQSLIPSGYCFPCTDILYTVTCLS